MELICASLYVLTHTETAHKSVAIYAKRPYILIYISTGHHEMARWI
jgi:hypothetical protein